MKKTSGRLTVWFQASRPFSFTASITPVFIGAAWAAKSSWPVSWFLLPVFLVCVVLIHAATNLISDYVDFKKGVDREYTFGSSGVLVQGLLMPGQVRKAAYVLFAVALALGLCIVAQRGWGMLLFGILGLMGGYFYTVGPVGYKYRALGDIFVFLFMGVFIVVGAFWALTGVVAADSVLISLPISCLVAAILYANNVRDIKHDQEAGVHTLAGRLGFSVAKKVYYILVFGAYGIVAVLVMLRITSPWTLAVVLSLPKALGNFSIMKAAVSGKPGMIATLDVQTAQLHLVFGVLFAAALAWGGR